PIDLSNIADAGILIFGFNPRRSGLHHFVLAGAGNDVNAPYTVRVTRTPITTTVNTAGIEVDGACDVYHCSLPEAIQASNSRDGVQTIGFNIPGGGIHRILPQGALQPIMDSVVIDGTTQPGYSGKPLIVLDGKLARSAHGVSNESFPAQLTVKGLALINFQRTGMNLASGSDHTIVSNFIGLDPETSLPAPNLEGGITVVGGSGHVIGLPGSGNTIASNGAFGIYLDGLNLDGTTVQGNLIGTNSDQLALGNNGPGLRINGGGVGIRIGGAADGAANAFADNAGPHVVVETRGRLEASIQGNRFATERAGRKGVVANLGTRGKLVLGGAGPGEGNTFTGPFDGAVDLTVDGLQPVFEVAHAGNTHVGNSVALRISESPQASVNITESTNLFEGDGQAIKAELRAAGAKSFGVDSAVRGSGSAFASFFAKPLEGTHITLSLSGQYDSARALVTTLGEGSVDVRVDKLAVTKTLAPDFGIDVDVGASGNVTFDGFRAEAHAEGAARIRVGWLAGQPVKATIDIKSSMIADSGTGIVAVQREMSDVSWKFTGNVYRNNGTGLDVYADSTAKASYEMVSNRYEAQTSAGVKANFKPIEGVAVQFSSTGELYDSNLRHAEFDIAGAGEVNIRVLDLKGSAKLSGRNESGLRYHITADVKASLNSHVDIRRTSITGSLGFGLKAEAEIPNLGKAFIEANASRFDGNRDGAVIIGWSFSFSEGPNTFNDNSGAGILAERSAVSITNDTINGNGTGIVIRGGSQVEIANNSISGNLGDGLVIESTRDASVLGNSIIGNRGVGVVLASDATARLDSNKFDGNAGGDVIGDQPTEAGDQAGGTPLDLEIRSANVGPSGDLEVVYSIGKTAQGDFPLTVVFMKTIVADPARPIEVHRETFASLAQLSEELRTVIPSSEGHDVVAGDRLIVMSRDGRDGTSKPFTVTSSRTARATVASTATAPATAASTATAPATVASTATAPATVASTAAAPATVASTATVPTAIAPAGAAPAVAESTATAPATAVPTAIASATAVPKPSETATGGSCRASSPASTGLEYVMTAILVGGLLGRRIRPR
ncbi:MAG: right-handed parallel beta-helix repeat-containing protein, partial [Chloroflexi bacterium]|nr:right-handed parallel beta-helix repeat-containing protein [Chloroflexota bacterium]